MRALWQWSHVWEGLLAPWFLAPLGVALAVFPAAVLWVSVSRLRALRREHLRSLIRAVVPDDEVSDEPATEDRYSSTRRARVLIAFIFVFSLLGFASGHLYLFQATIVPGQHGGFVAELALTSVGYALLGFLGSYFHVCLSMVQRVRAKDLPDTALARFARSLVSGPTVASFVALLPGLTGGTQNGAGTAGDSLPALSVTAFLLGAYPALADDYLAKIAARVFGTELSREATRPIIHLSGMTPDVVVRLGEGGYHDAQHLCYENPFLAIANLPFAVRQILDWIDEALLYRYLSTKEFQNRTDAGITGAMDLIYQWRVHHRPLAPAPQSTETSPFYDIADELGMDKGQLQRICQSLDEDRQLLLLWALFNSWQAADPSIPSLRDRE